MSKWSFEQSLLGDVLVAPALPDGVALFYTTCDTSGRLDEATRSHLAGFLLERFGLDAPLSTCAQLHGTTVHQVEQTREAQPPVAAGSEVEPVCDALWSQQLGVSLGIKVADCLPVTVVDPAHSIIANLHAGWRGSARGVIETLLEQLRSRASFNPTGALAWLGPSIRSCCFEVGEEVIEELRKQDPLIDASIDRSRGPRPFLDLAGFARRRLVAGGIDEGRIHDSGECTRCEGSRFHSYRRSGPAAGRNLAVVSQ
ncbi:MAG TPA: polyphenol oxidase family protein [Thermoanaerobaculia bacterium]|nr:polyphenol oxidase family protein [Thermoanaerobaculia bacterium]